MVVRGERIEPQRRREAGGSLIEVLIATAVLLVASLTLAYAFTAAGLASRAAEHDSEARRSVEETLRQLEDVPAEQLLSWNGALVGHGDHDVRVEVHATTSRLSCVECTAVDHRTQAVRARAATWRASES